MRKGFFIESLNVREVPITDCDKFKYHELSATPQLRELGGGNAAFTQPDCVPIRSVHIHKLSKAVQSYNEPTYFETKYIAYSKEVQELLEMPFDVLQKRIEELEKSRRFEREEFSSRITEIKNANLLQRIKFLFLGAKAFKTGA